MIYKTIQGETWDSIAKKVYQSESYTSFLMKNNPDKLDYLIFPQGVELKIVELPQDDTTVSFPAWRE